MFPRTNIEGLTFSEWFEAAGYDAQGCIPKRARASWQAGEDPSDHRVAREHARRSKPAGRRYNVCEVFVCRTGPTKRFQFGSPVWENIAYSAEVACEQAVWTIQRLDALGGRYGQTYTPDLALYERNSAGQWVCKGGFFGGVS